MWLAKIFTNERIIKILLSKGIDINEDLESGNTALHFVSSSILSENAYVLCKHGADLNRLNSDGKPPIAEAVHEDTHNLLLIELAKLKYNNKFICKENLDHLQKDAFVRYRFETYVKEIDIIKNYKFFDNYTIADIMKMDKDKIKLVNLMKNTSFRTKLISVLKLRIFYYYGKEVEKFLNDAIEIKCILESKEKILGEIFKDHLPAIPIRKIAYFVNKDLIFQKKFELYHF